VTARVRFLTVQPLDSIREQTANAAVRPRRQLFTNADDRECLQQSSVTRVTPTKFWVWRDETKFFDARNHLKQGFLMRSPFIGTGGPIEKSLRITSWR
jgi:hypothetical protein